MLKNLPRRQRLIALTSTAGLIFLATISTTVWVLSTSERPYLPGEKIEGLRADLERSLPPDVPQITFVDVSEQAGIFFRHFSGERSAQLPEDMGSGAAWGDYDNDGWLDLFVANEVGPLALSEEAIRASAAHCALYHNNGDGTFTEVSAKAGVDYRGWVISAAWGDYDNDGWPDLFLACYGENRFYVNNGDGTFRVQTDAAGLGGKSGFWAGASWADFNRDGFLDLYVSGYVKYSDLGELAPTKQYDVEVPASINPSAFEPERNLLYRNNGDGSFVEIAVKAGVADIQGRSLSAAWCDFDDDGWPDLYVANDVSDNVLYRNLGSELFEEISHAALVADYRGAMGIAVGDWDGDADMDMFITHWIAQENALYTNRSGQFAMSSRKTVPLRFMDEADRYGLGQIALDYVGWGTSFLDYDNDGRLDLFVANGSTFQQKERPPLLIPMLDQLFWNSGTDQGFYDVSTVSGALFEDEYVGRGAAFGDYDNDGDVDLFVVNNGGPGQLLRNDGGNQKSWLKIQLQGNESNRMAVGARLRLVHGQSVQIRQVGVQSSYCSQNSLVQHFGLGDAAKADSLEIVWPTGRRQLFTDLPVRQTVLIEEGNEGLQ